MACPPNAPPRDTFVVVHGNGFLQSYNSRLPVVVYVPTGFEVRYRIWEARPEIGQAQADSKGVKVLLHVGNCSLTGKRSDREELS